MTHRAWYVSAGCPLAVGPGCSRTSDFLLLPQQLTVLLLPVLHVDQQRDEAVLHLFCKTQNSKVFVGFKDQTQNVLHLFIHELLLEQSVLSTVKNTRWLFVIEANNIVEIKLQVIHWPPSPVYTTLWALQSVLTTHQMFKWLDCLQIKFLSFKSSFTTEHICSIVWLVMT